MDITFYTTGLVVGFFSSTHCLGMCGGIVGALDNGLSKSSRSLHSQIVYHLTYNLGRILSYVILGALAGLIGSVAAKFSLGSIIPIGRLIAGLFMIALGLYLAGWWHAITYTEKAGLHIWNRIKPLGQHFLPADTPARAFGLGMVWGWLPCGLVYSVLTLAAASASPQTGALTMLGFGLGTLPMLLAMGGIAKQLTNAMRRPAIRQIMGMSIILFGAYTCFTAFSMHNHHSSSSTQLAPAFSSSGVQQAHLSTE